MLIYIVSHFTGEIRTSLVTSFPYSQLLSLVYNFCKLNINLSVSTISSALKSKLRCFKNVSSSAVSDSPYPDPCPILESGLPPTLRPGSHCLRRPEPPAPAALPSALQHLALVPPSRTAVSAIPEIDEEVAEGVPLLGAVGLSELGILIQPVWLKLGHRGRLWDRVRAHLPPAHSGLRPRGFLLGRRRARGQHRLSLPSPGPGLLDGTRGQGGARGRVQLGAYLLVGAQASWQRLGV